MPPFDSRPPRRPGPPGDSGMPPRSGGWRRDEGGRGDERPSGGWRRDDERRSGPDSRPPSGPSRSLGDSRGREDLRRDRPIERRAAPPLQGARPAQSSPAVPPTESRESSPSQPPEARETAICGWNAVSALFERRPEGVKRLFFEERLSARTGPWCSALAASRRVYRQVPAGDLEKLSDTIHHGGIVAIAEERRINLAMDADAAGWARAGKSVLVIDGVGNPHNLGFLARTAAFFGFGVVLIGSRGLETAPRSIPPSSHRVAEGAFEWLEVRHVPKLEEFIHRNRSSFLWCATDVRTSAESLEQFDARRLHRPPAIVFGNEESGVSEAVLRACEKRFVVPGTGRVESLNVAASAAIVLHHFAPAVKRLGGS